MATTRTLPLPTPSLLPPSSPSPSSRLSRERGPRTSVPTVPQSSRKNFPKDIVKVKVKVNISLTPGTHFSARSRQRYCQGSAFPLRSPGSGSQGFRSRDRSLGLGRGGERGNVTYSLRPLTSVESIHTLRLQQHQDSATSSIQYISTINKNYVTSCEFPNIPSLMLSSANKRSNSGQNSGNMETTRSTHSVNQQASSPKQEAEVEEPFPEKSPGRSGEELGGISTPSLTPRPRSFHVQSASEQEEGRENWNLKTASLEDVRADRRWPKRDLHAHVRLFPPVSPFRNSARTGSSLRQHGGGENQKMLLSARHTPVTDQPQTVSSTPTLLREATMYDLNDQGVLTRPLEGVLPPPDRKAHSRHHHHHRRRSPEKKKKDRAHRPLPQNNDCLLVVTPREKKVKNERTV